MPDEQHLDLSTFEICLACGGLRGGATREHRCRCQPHTPEWKRHWRGRDMARDLEMCVLCVRETVTTFSKWSWLACETCRRVSEVVGAWCGKRSALPLGRHSIMNGDIVEPMAATDTETDRVAQALSGFLRRWDSLYAWRKAEFDRLAGPLRDGRVSVPLLEWQRRWPTSLGASVDAFDRYGVVPVPLALTDLRQAQHTFRSSAF